MFYTAYSQVYCKQNNSKRKAVELEEESVDYSELWDIDEADMVAV